MPWSEGVIEQFDIVDLDTTEESDFYGPFLSLLVELFPVAEHYQVAPQPTREGTVQFIVRRRRVPLLVLHVQTFRALGLLAARVSADERMRDTVREFVGGAVGTGGTLYGLSAFGPRFCVYVFDSATRRLEPPGIARELGVVNDTAPEARWAHNLLEPAGEARLREVVRVVKGMADGL